MCWRKPVSSTRPHLSRPNAVIQLGDQTVNALLDTGSTVTLCDDSIRPTPGLNCRPLPLSLDLPILRAANGGQFPITRFMRVKITLGGREGDLPLSVKGRYQALLREYADIFLKHDLDVGHSQTIPHTVRLTDHNKVVSVNQYRLKYHLQEVAIDYAKKLLKSGVIRPSTSVFNSSLMLVKKPNADLKKTLGEQY